MREWVGAIFNDWKDSFAPMSVYAIGGTLSVSNQAIR